jgi:WD40 repeat protein
MGVTGGLVLYGEAGERARQPMTDNYPGQDNDLPAAEFAAPSSPSSPSSVESDPIGTVVIERSTGIQVGDRNVQHNTVHVYSYGPATWTSRSPQQPVPGSPYRGLRAFEERDRDLFFGREAAIAEVMTMLSAVERDSVTASGPAILVVAGASGAGKSSLLQAGVLPRLRRDGTPDSPEAGSWPCLLLTPGRSPLDELAAQVAAIAGVNVGETRAALATRPEQFALLARQAVLAQQSRDQRQAAAGRGRLLLVIDQFEQLFTHCQREEERDSFIRALYAAATGGPAGPSALIVIGVRIDFEARCADYPELTAAVKNRRCLLTAMTDRELELAITEPAKRAGAHVEPGLVDRLGREIRTRRPGATAAATSAGALPLLSYALAETWRVHRGIMMTLADYDQTGGIETAVETAAKRAYDKLDEGQQETARLIFLQLTATSSDGADTAIPATFAELDAGKEAADVRAVLDAFAAERLLTLDADGAQISHEVLLTAWPLLRDTWLGETRADRTLLSKLRDAAADWSAHRRDGSYLWSGALLGSALATVERAAAGPGRLPPLAGAETWFLAASQRAAQRQRRRRQGLAVLTALILVAGAVGVAVVHVTESAAAAARAQAAALAATTGAEKLAADSVSADGTDPVLARLEALAAWRLAPSSVQASYSLLNAAAQPELAFLPSPTGVVDGIAFSPKGNLFATVTDLAGNGNSQVQLWNATTLRPAGPQIQLSGPTGVSSMAFNDDGTELAIAAPSSGTELWKVSEERLTYRTKLPDCSGLGAYAVTFMPDSATVITADSTTSSSPASAAGCAQIWDTASGVSRNVSLPSQGISVASSPNGRFVAVGTDQDGAYVWNMSTGQPATNILSGSRVGAVAFSPDNTTLATATNVVQLWNTATLQPEGDPLSAGGPLILHSLSYSPDGQFLAEGACCAAQGPAHLWNVAARQQVSLPLVGGAIQNEVREVAFYPHQSTLAVATEDGTQLWNAPAAMADTGGPAQDPPSDISGGGSVVAFSANGTLVAVGDADANDAAIVLDTVTRRVVSTIPASSAVPARSVEGLAFSPDGKTLTVLGALGNSITAQHWRLATRTAQPLPGGLQSHALLVYGKSGNPAAALSSDGSMLIAAERTGLELWNLTASDPAGTLFGPGNATAVQFTANDAYVAATVGNDTRLWNLATKSPGRAQIPTDGYSWVLSPDGRTLAVTDQSIEVNLWNTATGDSLGVSLADGNETFNMAFSPDGDILATTGLEGVQLWDIATSQTIGDPLPGTGGVGSVAFDPAGTELATAADKGPAQLWEISPLTPGQAATAVCPQTGQTLSQSQWAQYAPGTPYINVCPSNPAG